MRHKIAAIGNKEALVLFESLGIDCFYLEEREELRRSLMVLAEKNYAIIFLAENLVYMVEEELKELNRRSLPTVTIIPMQPKKENLALERMSNIAARATGVKII